jgi:hypothetical protein
MQNMNFYFISPKNQTQNLSNYSKNVTGGNDPTISKAMRYSQKVRNTRYSVLSVLKPPTLQLQDFSFNTTITIGNDPSMNVIIFPVRAYSNSPGAIRYISSDMHTLVFEGNIGIIKPTDRTAIYKVTITALQEQTNIYQSASTNATVTIYPPS